MPLMALWLLSAESAEVTVVLADWTLSTKRSDFWCRLQAWIWRS